MDERAVPPETAEAEQYRCSVLDEPFFGGALRFALARLGGVEGKRVVEIGCGEGGLAVFLALGGATVVGVDRREDALERARGLAARWRVAERCTFLRGDAQHLPLAAGAADAVFSRSTLQYMDRERTLEEVLRVLRPGGALVLMENLPHNPFIALYRLRRRLGARTPDEHAYLESIRGYLTPAEVERMGERFRTVAHREFHLCRMLTMALCQDPRRGAWARWLDRAAARVDEVVLSRVPASRRLAWFVAVVGEGKTG